MKNLFLKLLKEIKAACDILKISESDMAKY